MKKILCLALAFAMLFCPTHIYAQQSNNAVPVSEDYTPTLSGEEELDCKSVILMEANTGAVLYEQNADQALPPASVTKIMTLLLVMEAIDSGKIKLDDTVVTSENAASMGGSQIYLEVGECMSVEDMLKSVIIASANDAACALAEHVCGSESEFVAQMNKKAAELGMKNTNFENTNGLDDTSVNHVTSARDIAIMSRELISHEKILEYSSIWMDTVRGGSFGLTNTNRLVRFYKGCTGLKTGSTDKAGFCISATAKRGNVSLICVVMGAPTRDIRNSIATTLLDRGFASFEVYKSEGKTLSEIPVPGATKKYASASYPSVSFLCEKGKAGAVKMQVSLNEDLSAPMRAGDVIGKVTYTIDGKKLGETDITLDSDVERIGYFELLFRGISRFFFK